MSRYGAESKPNPDRAGRGAREWLRRRIPLGIRRGLRRALAAFLRRLIGPYAVRRLQERLRFARDVEVHALPPIFHYWSNTHLRPLLESIGCISPDDFLARAVHERVHRGGFVRVLSIGAGNCELELSILAALPEASRARLRMVCLDLVPEMLSRGRARARDLGLDAFVDFVCADFNDWPGVDQGFDLVIANQCLHHVQALECLMGRMARWLHPEGAVLVSDMIGRNGHRRWPEALHRLQPFWAELPREYRYNRQLARQEERFLDWDCSTEGFEGIRSQDILPLLCAHFGFVRFFAWGNLIDPFVDRAFGPNFDVDNAWDRDFIDRVHAADVAAMDAGEITPTHLLAELCLDRCVVPQVWGHRTPQHCLRDPGAP